MEICSLCLESNISIIGGISAYARKWQEENVSHFIEKHLWSIKKSQQTSICFNCWQELKRFHQFYMRIAEAHSNLDAVISYNKGMQLNHNNKGSVEINTDHFLNKSTIEKSKGVEKEDLIKNQYEPEICLEQPLPTDFVIENETEIKLELETKSLEELQDKNNSDILNTTDPLNKENALTETKETKETAKRSHKIDSEENFQKHSELQFKEKNKKKRKNPDEQTCQEYDRFIADNFQIVCSLCYISLENFIVLRQHFRDEHKKRGFVICCKRKIFSRPLLVDHIHMHLDPNYFKCQHCDKVYAERSTLESHNKIHEMHQQERNHLCTICSKTFVGSLQLENHKKVHEPGYEKQFPCNKCGKLFTTTYSLNYHIQAIHHNKFVNICDICGKTMRCRNQFKLHMEKHNSNESLSMNCDICGLRLTDRRGLRRHKNSQHPVGGRKEYFCHLCTKVSPNPEALRTHVRLTHSASYNHKCTMCDKAFKRPYALREHIATHTGTALYSCPWCFKTFISNGNMHNHRKKAHPKEWEEAHRQRFSNNLPTVQSSTVLAGNLIKI